MITDPDLITVLQYMLFDGGAIHECTVAALEVDQLPRVPIMDDLGVSTGNVPVGNTDLVGRHPAQKRLLPPQSEGPTLLLAHGAKQLRH